MKVSIIGAGNVGGLTAIQLCSQGVSEIVLVDAVKGLACAKALDLSDAKFILKQNYLIRGTEDISQIKGSQILIITAGLPRKPGMKREELALKNSQIIKGISQQIKHLCPEAVIIVVTNPLDAMTYCVIKETQLPERRIFGMGLTLDRSRLANLIAEELNIPVSEIEPCVIGSHGEAMLPLSGYTKVKGSALDKQLEPEVIGRIFQKTVKRGAEIVSYLGSGSAYFAPSTAIVELAKAIIDDKQRILPVSVYLKGEYGLKDICIGLPCCLGKNGVERVVELELNTKEREAFLESAESIKKQISAINNSTKKCLT
ncbi:MAG: malate dehydrogenase [Candidatus Omnitrophota bacterium]|jgi:malate dehydrogenase